MSENVQYAVIGAGALGGATAYWLAERGATDVVVLEQYAIGHSLGASEDHSRIIRHSYHSNIYADLTQAAYDGWADLEERSGLQLVTRTGGLDLASVGGPGEAELDNYERSLTHIGVAYETLTAEDIRRRWPQWRIDDATRGLFQADSGILDIRRAAAAHVALARQAGVEFRPHTPVRGLQPTPTHVGVQTDQGVINAEHVIVCTASWSSQLLPHLGLDWRITLTQEQVSYFATPNIRDFAPDRFPIWIWHDEPLFYGFPVYGEVAIKAARDMSGRFVTQETRSFEPRADETERIRQFLLERLPGSVGPELFSKTCVYDMPADRDFVLDRAPGHPNVTIGIGAGHAAKFADLIGQILADVTLTGSTKHPIEAFRADRPALADPTFPAAFRMVG
jgi:monomeric sarcosine oxidase